MRKCDFRCRSDRMRQVTDPESKRRLRIVMAKRTDVPNKGSQTGIRTDGEQRGEDMSLISYLLGFRG